MNAYTHGTLFLLYFFLPQLNIYMVSIYINTKSLLKLRYNTEADINFKIVFTEMSFLRKYQ